VMEVEVNKNWEGGVLKLFFLEGFNLGKWIGKVSS
jgi:hypothetical protein